LDPNLKIPPRSGTLIAAALLLAALGLVVLYTGRSAFLSPLALVVVAAIGFAALLLQIRLRPELSNSHGRKLAPASLPINILGVIFAAGAVFGDVLRLGAMFSLVTALGAVACFAISGIILLSALRRRHKPEGP
jgi:predicted MFS family arabinose efflux permease